MSKIAETLLLEHIVFHQFKDVLFQFEKLIYYYFNLLYC